MPEPFKNQFNKTIISGMAKHFAKAWPEFDRAAFIAADAVLDALSHSDFRRGGTNARGHQLAINIGLRQGVQAAFNYCSATIDSGIKMSKSGRDKLQVDLKFKFK